MLVVAVIVPMLTRVVSVVVVGRVRMWVIMAFVGMRVIVYVGDRCLRVIVFVIGHDAATLRS